MVAAFALVTVVLLFFWLLPMLQIPCEELTDEVIAALEGKSPLEAPGGT